MSFTKTTIAQNNDFASSSKDADLATPMEEPRRTLFPRLLPALHLNHYCENSTMLSNPNPETENPPTSLRSDPQTHPPTASNHSSEKLFSRLPADAQTESQIAAPPRTRNPYSEFERDDGDTELESLPPGFPYTGWYGAWCFACEFVRSMQALVTERMEGSGKYGAVRRTT